MAWAAAISVAKTRSSTCLRRSPWPQTPMCIRPGDSSLGGVCSAKKERCMSSTGGGNTRRARQNTDQVCWRARRMVAVEATTLGRTGRPRRLQVARRSMAVS